MVHKFFIILNILFVVCISTLQAQGRIDTDRIINKIWWSSQKIDTDTSIHYSLTTTLSRNNSNIIAYYTKNDFIYKIVRLAKDLKGTQKTTFYYSDNKPVFIELKTNDYNFANDKNLFLTTLLSFDEKSDTSSTIKKVRHKLHFHAQYFFNKGKVYYSNVRTEYFTRSDNKNDIGDGLVLYAEGEQYYAMYNKVKAYFDKK